MWLEEFVRFSGTLPVLTEGSIDSFADVKYSLMRDSVSRSLRNFVVDGYRRGQSSSMSYGMQVHNDYFYS